MSLKAEGKKQREEREQKLILKHKYDNRITIAKFGKEAFRVGDYGNAAHKYNEFLDIYAKLHGLPDIFTLSPNHFDAKKDITEMLLISHVYFEMARMYDASPKFYDECKKSLNQFVLFTANQSYQVLNSEMIRRYLRKVKFKNTAEFQNAYQQIYVQSKKCYIATMCFGENHSITHDLRQFKKIIQQNRFGYLFIRFYYLVSNEIVYFLENHPKQKHLSKVILKPLLTIVTRLFINPLRALWVY